MRQSMQCSRGRPWLMQSSTTIGASQATVQEPLGTVLCSASVHAKPDPDSPGRLAALCHQGHQLCQEGWQLAASMLHRPGRCLAATECCSGGSLVLRGHVLPSALLCLLCLQHLHALPDLFLLPCLLCVHLLHLQQCMLPKQISRQKQLKRCLTWKTKTLLTFRLCSQDSSIGSTLVMASRCLMAEAHLSSMSEGLSTSAAPDSAHTHCKPVQVLAPSSVQAG